MPIFTGTKNIKLPKRYFQTAYEWKRTTPSPLLITCCWPLWVLYSGLSNITMQGRIIKNTACDQDSSNYLTTKSWIIPPPLPRTESWWCFAHMSTHRYPNMAWGLPPPMRHAHGVPAPSAQCQTHLPHSKAGAPACWASSGDSTAFSRARSTASRSQTTASLP